MMRHKCGKTQVYNTLKQKDKIMNEWLQGMKRRAMVTGNEEINEVVFGVVHRCKIKTFTYLVQWCKVKLSQ
jgi:hypothetical protein